MFPDWSQQLASRVRNTSRAGIPEFRERVREAKSRGVSILPIENGLATSELPPHVIEALSAAEADPSQCPVRGLPRLRQAMAQKLYAHNKIKADPKTNILVTNGAKQALHVALAAMVDPGDEVIFPTPSYLYDGMIGLLGAIPRPVPMSEQDGFRLDISKLEAAITPRTKVLLINNPVNPTGVVLTKSELDDIGALAYKHDLLLLFDEAHEYYVYDGREHLSIAASSRMSSRTVTVFSLSKIHRMVPHRVGYLVGPSDVIDAAEKILEWEVLTNSLLPQVAALAVFEGPQDYIAQTLEKTRQNRDLIQSELASIPNLEYSHPEGGVANLINVSKTGMDGTAFSNRLLFDYGIIAYPGSIFGAPKHIRMLAMISEPEVIREAMTRIRDASR